MKNLAPKGGRNHEEAVYSSIVRDLRKLRQGPGLALTSRLNKTTSLLGLFASDGAVGATQTALGILKDLLDDLGESIQAKAIRNAFAIGMEKKPGTLTQRREDFGRSHGGLHSDTVENYENKMIEELASRLLACGLDTECTSSQANVEMRAVIENSTLPLLSLNGKGEYIFMQDTTIDHQIRQVSTVVYHGTKFNVPNANQFWNELLTRAERRFYLIGRTNKSWFFKGGEQSRLLADAVVKIASQGGQVKILSSDDPAVIERTKSFFDQYVAKQITHTSEDESDSLVNHITYVVAQHCNYDAAVSDDRLVLLPTPNTEDFRNEAMVIELTAQADYQPFTNYLADIERTLAEAKVVPILGQSDKE